MSLSTSARTSLISRFPPPEDRSIWNVPSRTFDLAAHQSLGTVISTQTPDSITVDVQSDFRYPHGAICRSISEVYNSLDLRSSPVASPAALAAYATHLLATFYLAHDIYTRETPSVFATAATQNNDIKDFFEATLNAHVPDFMIDILDALAPFTPDTMPHVLAVPSLAGYCSRHDAYRYPPSMLYLSAHNIMATYPSNTSPMAITELWLRTPIFRIGTVAFPANNWLNQLHSATVAGQTTLHQQQNWFNVLVNQIFTPITTRAIANRPVFTRINIAPVSVPAQHAVNPYVMLLGYATTNLDGLRLLYNTGSTLSNSNFNGKKRLGDYLIEKSSGAVFRHALHAAALPTWTDSRIDPPTPAQRAAPTATATEPEFRPPQDQAASAALLPVRTAQTMTNVGFSSNANDEASRAVVLLHRRRTRPAPTDANANATEPHDLPEYGTFRTFNVEFDNMPSTMYHGYPELAPTSFAGPIQAGITIECEEISSVIVPLPNIRETNSFTNSQLLSACVPISSTRRVSSDYANQPLYERTIYTFRTQPFGLTLGSTHFVGLPRFNFRTAPQLVHTTPLPHFEPMDAVHELRLGYTAAFGRFGSPAPATPERIHLWSPYRYVRSQSSTTVDIFASYAPVTTTITAAEQESSVFVLPTLRCILGCQYKYGEGIFPARTFF